MRKTDDDLYQEALNDMMAAQSTSLANMIDGIPWGMGLRDVILRAERPYADQNAQADVEGRPRPVQVCAIDKSPSAWWKTSHP